MQRLPLHIFWVDNHLNKFCGLLTSKWLLQKLLPPDVWHNKRFPLIIKVEKNDYFQIRIISTRRRKLQLVHSMCDSGKHCNPNLVCTGERCDDAIVGVTARAKIMKVVKLTSKKAWGKWVTSVGLMHWENMHSVDICMAWNHINGIRIKSLATTRQKHWRPMCNWTERNQIGINQ